MASRETQFRIALLGLFLLRCQSFTLSNEEYVSEPVAGRKLQAHSCDDHLDGFHGLTGSCDAGCPSCPEGQAILTGQDANPCDQSDSYSPQCHPASCNNPCGQGTCFDIRETISCAMSNHTGCDCAGCCNHILHPPPPPMQPTLAYCPWLAPDGTTEITTRIDPEIVCAVTARRATCSSTETTHAVRAGAGASNATPASTCPPATALRSRHGLLLLTSAAARGAATHIRSFVATGWHCASGRERSSSRWLLQPSSLTWTSSSIATGPTLSHHRLVSRQRPPPVAAASAPLARRSDGDRRGRAPFGPSLILPPTPYLLPVSASPMTLSQARSTISVQNRVTLRGRGILAASSFRRELAKV